VEDKELEIHPFEAHVAKQLGISPQEIHIAIELGVPPEAILEQKQRKWRDRQEELNKSTPSLPG
jgi:hypothetical protein